MGAQNMQFLKVKVPVKDPKRPDDRDRDPETGDEEDPLLLPPRERVHSQGPKNTRGITMDRRRRRCGLVAAAGVASLLVADVQGFAFTLQHRAASRTAAAVGGRSAAREAVGGGGGSRRGGGPVAASAPWGSRRARATTAR